MCDRFAPEAAREGRLAEYAANDGTACDAAAPAFGATSHSPASPAPPLHRLFAPLPVRYVPMNHRAFLAQRRRHLGSMRRDAFRRTQSCGNLLLSSAMAADDAASSPH
jgi:hypothetical protein